MPIFEYKCDKCGQITEHLERHTAVTIRSCPKCGAQLQRQFSTFSVGLKQPRPQTACDGCESESCPYSGN